MPILCFALSGHTGLNALCPQGVALGWHVLPLQGRKPAIALPARIPDPLELSPKRRWPQRLLMTYDDSSPMDVDPPFGDPL